MAPSRKYARKPLKKKKRTDNVKSVIKPVQEKDEIISIGCTTPKAQKHQIPEILTCPPAPKKRKIVSSCTLRRPISFFDPPDIELFFASHFASIYNHVQVHTHVR
ncbi:putative cyclin-dependent protein kinase inhibitor SMR [Helianthus debilis subsp. tardiflorus]